MKKYFFYTIIFIAGLILNASDANAQGCVAVRGMSCSGGTQALGLSSLEQGQFQFSASYRYFQSYKHFVGDVEQTQRVALGTQVVNTVNNIDLGLAYGLTNRLSVTLNLPVSFFDRSQLLSSDIKLNPQWLRFHTGAQGIGDIRLSADYLLFNPASAKGNVSVGAGIKIPTGNANAQGTFHNVLKDGRDSTTVHAVDQSIQLGDGGWGFTVQTQGFFSIFKNASVYFNGFYMFNPREVNNTLNKGTLAGVDPIIAYQSVADQYAARIGINYIPVTSWGLAVSLGGRLEGIPSHDLIGGSSGFRRPGYIISAEPGLAYSKGNSALVVSLPVALYRNRTKSYYDLQDPTGVRWGDAAFADYLVNATFTHRFGRSGHAAMPVLPKWQQAGPNQ